MRRVVHREGVLGGEEQESELVRCVGVVRLKVDVEDVPIHVRVLRKRLLRALVLRALVLELCDCVIRIQHFIGLSCEERARNPGRRC